MRLTVDHLTRYSYATPVRSVVQSHRLTPSVFEGQRVVDWTISVSGGQRGAAFRDGAGDWIEGWTVRGPVEEVTVAKYLELSHSSKLTGVMLYSWANATGDPDNGAGRVCRQEA